TSGNNTLYGSDSAGLIDVIRGHEGNDNLYAYAGDDTLEGGTGNDELYGDDGDDTYMYAPGDGNDYLLETVAGGNDTLWLTGGITTQDVRMWIDGGEDMYVHISSTGGVIQIAAAEVSGVTDVGMRLETIRFDDDTVWNLTQGLILNSLDTSQYVY